MTAPRPRTMIYGRLGLALALPLIVTGLLGVVGWHAWQQQQATATARQTVQTSIKTLQARQAEYRPGGAGYQRYIALLNSGFAAPDSPAAWRGLVKKLARQQEVAVQSLDIGAARQETAAGTLSLLGQPVMITASAGSDSALFAFIDALRRSGHAELTLNSLDLKTATDGVSAQIGFSWTSLANAPQLEYLETPVELADALAGKSLFPAAPNPTTAIPAAMVLKVEDAKP